jgi:hypothetical protein
MTIQSLAWAIEQPVPGTAKLVLYALANRACHINGFVHFDAGTIAHEASIQISGLWRYLGALERNGYLSKDERKTAEGEKRDYWLVLDRDNPASWAWGQSAEDRLRRGDQESATPRPSKSFRREHQDQVRKNNIEEDAAHSAQGVPIIEGSKAFHAWCGHLRNHNQLVPFIQAINVNGKWLRGFYRPTLFPLKEQNEENNEVAL